MCVEVMGCYLARGIGNKSGCRQAGVQDVPCPVTGQQEMGTAAFGRNQRGAHAMDSIKSLSVWATATSRRWGDQNSCDCLMLLELRTLHLGPGMLLGDPSVLREERVLHGASFRQQMQQICRANHHFYPELN